MSLNVVTVTGTLVRDPQLDYQPSGPVTRLDVRCFSYEKGENGKWEKTKTILPVVVKGLNAERVAGWLKEGLLVEVEGKLQGFDVPAVNSKTKACAILARRVDQVKG